MLYFPRIFMKTKFFDCSNVMENQYRILLRSESIQGDLIERLVIMFIENLHFFKAEDRSSRQHWDTTLTVF